MISFAACFEQADFGPDRAAHSGIAGEHMILVQPRAIDAVMARGGAEIPYPGVAGSRQQAIPDQLVAGPLADDGAGDVADVVLIETEHGAEAGLGQRLARACQPVAVQAAKVDALFEIHLSRAGRLEGPVPAMVRLEIVFVDRQESPASMIFRSP